MRALYNENMALVEAPRATTRIKPSRRLALETIKSMWEFQDKSELIVMPKY